ncbi:DUF6585 family protein [Nocardia pseudovaccinii]|uniref:DUF6585 family protein n=1 Tax=Nocardia pseudovaccinii TaxID=189540 RepID=UPI003D94A010
MPKAVGIIVVGGCMFVLIGLLVLPILLWQRHTLDKRESDVGRLATEAGLGSERRRYLASLGQIVTGLWGAALPAAATAAGVVLFFFSGPMAEDLGGARWAIGLPVCLLTGSAALYMLERALSATSFRIHLFDGGLVHFDTTTDAHTIRWDEADIYGEIGRYVKSNGSQLDSSLRLDPTITVRHRDGTKLKITENQFDGVAELVSTIQRTVTRVRLPAMLQDIAEGRRLEFGPFVVDRSGISVKGTMVPWPEVSRFTYVSVMSFGCVGLSYAGNEVSETEFDEDIPNLVLLVTLVETLRRDRTEESARQS